MFKSLLHLMYELYIKCVNLSTLFWNLNLFCKGIKSFCVFFSFESERNWVLPWFLCDLARLCRRPLRSHCFLCVGNGQCPFRNSRQNLRREQATALPHKIITTNPICARRVLHKIYRVADAPCKGRYGQFTVRRQSEVHYGFIGDFADCAVLS